MKDSGNPVMKQREKKSESPESPEVGRSEKSESQKVRNTESPERREVRKSEVRKFDL